VQKWLISAAFQNRTINLQKSLKESRKIEDGRRETEDRNWKYGAQSWKSLNGHWSSIIDYLKTFHCVP
jgi:hypothetical protein